jgi:hypothetical protein
MFIKKQPSIGYKGTNFDGKRLIKHIIYTIKSFSKYARIFGKMQNFLIPKKIYVKKTKKQKNVLLINMKYQTLLCGI